MHIVSQSCSLKLSFQIKKLPCENEFWSNQIRGWSGGIFELNFTRIISRALTS